MDQVCHSQGKIKGKQYQTIWKNNNFLTSGNIFDSVKVREFYFHCTHYPLKGVEDFNMETEILVVCTEN